MAKQKRYYLISQWNPRRGQSAENPSCLFGPCGSRNYYNYPLENVDPEDCYTSYKQAVRYADRWMNGGHCTCDVIDVTEYVR